MPSSKYFEALAILTAIAKAQHDKLLREVQLVQLPTTGTTSKLLEESLYAAKGNNGWDLDERLSYAAQCIEIGKIPGQWPWED